MARARRGAILPHAPVLVPDVALNGGNGPVERVRAAVRQVARSFGGTTVVVSPHGPRSGVYLAPRGDLAGFGVPRASARAGSPERAVRALAARWGRPILEEPADHGIVVPMLLGPLAGPVIGVALAEGEEPTDAARALARALDSSELDVVASVNSGAGITPRAPLTELDGAADLERELRDALSDDVAGVADVASRLASDGGSCGLGPLLVMAELFAGYRAGVLAHEWPFGVGHVVAVVGEAR